MNQQALPSVPFFSRRSMAVAAFEKDLYFFGGVGAAGTESILDVSDDFWKYDTEKMVWNEIKKNGDWPSARRCVGFSSFNNTLLLWGGSGISHNSHNELKYNFLNDLWSFSVESNRWAQVSVSQDHLHTPIGSAYPCPRYTPVFLSFEQRIFLFGGYTEDRLGKRKLNDTWIFKNNIWHQIVMPNNVKSGYSDGSNWPGIRYGCMSAKDANNAYICGGFSDDGDHIDVWSYNLTSQQWEILASDYISSAPMARYSAAFCYYDEKLFMFGGRSRRYPKLNFNDLWMFDLKTRAWVMLTENHAVNRYDSEAITPAYHAKASSISVGSDWYLWGGEGIHGHVSDFWRYDLISNNWQQLAAARFDDPIFW